MDHHTLTRPKVADLIEMLSRFPDDALVEIIDMDTGMRIKKFNVGHSSSNGYDAIPNENVYLWGTTWDELSDMQD